jgi:hypothetical protein
VIDYCRLGILYPAAETTMRVSSSKVLTGQIRPVQLAMAMAHFDHTAWLDITHAAAHADLEMHPGVRRIIIRVETMTCSTVSP